jgi:hypothetical protein
MTFVSSPAFGEAEDAAAAAAAAAKAAEDAKKVEFSEVQQKKVNELVANERKKAVADLEALKKTTGITVKHKEELEKQISDLKASYQTKAEQDQEKFDRTLNEYKTNYETQKVETDRWRNDFTNTVIERDILAAASADAFNPELVVQVLKPHTRLVEILDADGKSTGKLEPRVKLPKTNKDGKTVELDLKPDEAIALMKETPAKYGSLFKSIVKSGLGGQQQGGAGGKTTDLGELAKTNPEEFDRQYRASRFPERKV